jgi:hypothetical protein
VMAFHIGDGSPRILWKNVPKDSTVALSWPIHKTKMTLGLR